MRTPFFTIVARNEQGRAGVLHTPHGDVETPAFLPVGTYGTVKAILPRDLKDLHYTMILGNTYHLYLKPGEEGIRRAGTLHRFLGWDGPILTDSGGFQVLSLSRLRKVTDEGVEFRSHINGSLHFLTPEKVIEFQQACNSDVMMPLDHPAFYPASGAEERACLLRTYEWLVRSVRSMRIPSAQALFGIVQGGFTIKHRLESSERTQKLDGHLQGYAVGGLSVGEPREQRRSLLQELVPHLPMEKPRYLMGVGTPEDIQEAVKAGVDLFDCVLPTRLGRHGAAFTSEGRLNLKQSRFSLDVSPLDPLCSCYACTTFTRSYLHHLVTSHEILACQLLTLHNLHFYRQVMKTLRERILSQSG